MAVIQNSFEGDGSTTTYNFTFPYLKTTDIKASIDATVTTAFTLPSATSLQFNTAPADGALIKIYRETDADSLTATFYAGSAIKSEDLNDNFTQNLYGVQEVTGRYISTLAPSLAGDLNLEKNVKLIFEGSTDSDGDHKTTLTVTDPTDARTITLPDVTGTVVTTGDTGTVTSAMIADSTIVAGDIANTTITGAKLVNDTITATQIANDAVTGNELADNAVDTAAVAASAITANELATNAVTTAKIADLAVTADKLDHTSVTPGSYTAADITITAEGRISAASNGIIQRSEIASDAIDGSKIEDNAVNSEHITAGAVAASELASNAVTTAKINADAVDGTKIADNSINSEHYVDGSIDHEHLATGIIQAENIANNNITNALMADNAIDSAEIVAGAIDTAHIADSQVTTAKIADVNVTTAKIANDAIDATKIADNAVVTAAINADAVTGAKIADDAVDSEHLAADSIDSEHYAAGSVDTTALASNAVTTVKVTDANITTAKIADDAVTTAKIADAELVTLAGMQTGTASKLAAGTTLTADIADLNQIDGMTKETSVTDDDAKFPTSGAVVDYVAAQIAPIGGLEVIANDASFPNTQPASGVVISIADAGGLQVASGTSDEGRTLNGTTVTINNIASNFNDTTIADGVAMMVSSTGSGHIYNYHKATLKEADLLSLSNDINDFAARYRVASTAPSSSLDEGDLWWDMATDKLKVYDGSAWEEVASSGDFYINTISSYSGTGGNSATFDGTAYRFVLSNPGSTAQQHVVSINGVIQKPNSGTSQPSEGFVIDGSSIIFSNAPASGSDYFILTLGSTVSIGTPSDNTVATAKLQNLAVTTAKIAADAVDGTKIADDAVNAEHIGDLTANLKWTDSQKAVFGAGDDLQLYHDGGNSWLKEAGTGALYIDTDGAAVKITKGGAGENMAVFNTDGAVELYNNNVKRFETTSSGVSVGGHLVMGDDDNIQLGDSQDLKLYHDGDDSFITNSAGTLKIQTQVNIDKADGSEHIARFVPDGAVELYHNGTKMFETTSGGIDVAGSGSFTSHIDINADDKKLRIGASNDLELYHDGSYSYIKNSHAGGLWVASDLVAITNGAVSETMAKFTADGAVELYHNHVKKLETFADGVKVIGQEGTSGAIQIIADDGDDAGDNWEIRSNQDANDLTFRNDTSSSFADIMTLEKDGDLKLTGDLWCTADNKKVQVGAGADLQIYHDGTDTYFDNNVGNFYIRNDGNSTTENIRIQGKGGEEGIVVTANGGVDLYHDNVQKFSTRSNGFMSSGVGEVYICAGSTDASGAGILLDGDSNGDFAGADYASIVHNTNGDLILETRRPAASNAVVGFKPYNGSDTSYAMILAHDACWSYHAFYPWTDADRDLGYSGRRWDDIYAENTSIIGTSDRNEKDNITNTDLGLSFINKLTPKSYKFKGKTRTHYGLIAQDIEDVLSDISKPTSGFAGFVKTDIPVEHYTQHDESIPEGKSIGDVKTAAFTRYGLRYSEFLAPLIKAVQELSTEVETLKTKVAALEAA